MSDDARPISAYTQWCREHDCTHGHCPLHCEHPQPSTYAGDKRIICGCCYFTDGTVSEIVPCRPETGCIDHIATRAD